MKKPTGDAECPPEIDRAHEINDKIQTKVSCRDLDDDDIADFKDSDDDMSDDTGNKTPRPKPTPRVRTTRKEPTPTATRQSSTRGIGFLDRIAQSLDPAHQAQRDAERTSTLFQSQQLIMLQAQIRDLNQLNQSLRTQLDDSERRRVDADRRADRLENQLYMTSVVNQVQQPALRPPYRGQPAAIVLSDSQPGSPNSEQGHRWEATFRDGGRCSWNGSGNRLDSDDSVVEVNRIAWSPTPHSRIQSPPPSDLD